MIISLKTLITFLSVCMHINILTQGHGKALVLLHGWGFDSQVWQPVLLRLLDDYQVYLVDLPGFGSSPYMPWNDFKAQLLERLPAHFAIAGWSMGGMYATRLMLEAPQRVSHLMNVASSPYFVKAQAWPGVLQSVFAAFHHNLVKAPEQTLREFVQLQLPLSVSYADIIGRLPSTEGLERGLDVLLTWDFRQVLQDINAKKICYLFGRLDAITPYKLMATMQKRYPQFQYHLFSKAAHAPFLSHSEEFVSILNAFVLR
jgi:pimeloyl-[acyl-carrier protein] methyl ester esterase